MLQRRRILIVEDDPDIIKLLSLVVRRGGHEPALAGGGKQALRLLRAKGADLILLDLMMADLNGWKVLDEVRADERLAHIPVIIVSARQEMEESERMKDHAGLYYCYVTKPFGIDELLARISEALPAPQPNASPSL